MSLGLLLLFLHITTMIAAATVSYGPALMFHLARRTNQVATIRAFAAPTVLGPAIPILYVIGGLFGLFTAINFGFNLLAPWLVIAYAQWVVAMLTGVAIHRPFSLRAFAALSAAPDGPVGPDVAAVLDEPRERAAYWLDYLIILGLLFDMVVKPFS
jgi:hypothetical protein